jgi:hypothetical protein
VIKNIGYTFLFVTFASPAFAQFSITFQNGVTLLPSGGVYEGTEDTEFRSLEPGLVTPLGENPAITVDGDDNLNVTQGAIRFTDLLVSEGGALPDEVATGAFPITRAVLTLWKMSPSDDGVIEFHRVIGEDNFSGDFWADDDAWADLVEILVPDPTGRPQEFPFYGNFLDPDMDGVETFFGDPVVGEIAPMPEFSDSERVEGGVTYAASIDSEDILDDFAGAVFDGSASPFDVFQTAFSNFDVTGAVQDWVVNGEVNAGWAITNNSGDGWDMASSDATGELTNQSFLDGETVLPGVDLTKMAPLPPGLAYGEVPGSLVIDSVGIRPRLTVFYEGAGGPADLDLNGQVDPDDILTFLENYGIEIDGVIEIGATGDFDFDRDVDPNDWLLFQAAYLDATNGAPAASHALAHLGATVPEPGAGLLAALAAMGVAAMRRRCIEFTESYQA